MSQPFLRSVAVTCTFDLELTICPLCAQRSKEIPVTSDIFCNVPAPPADPSHPGRIPERGSALTDRCNDALPADLASPA